jgi:methionine transaminase
MIQSKMPDVGTTIFAIMSGLAEEHGAINLSQGFPDFNPSEKLIALVNRYMERGYNQYSPPIGHAKLRQAIAEKTEGDYGVYFDSDTEITVTSGATEALFCAIIALIKAGDEVVLFEPAYDSYLPVIRLSGGVGVHIELSYPDYKIDWEEVRSKISAKTRMIILNNPQNPTGNIFDEEDIKTLGEIAEKNDLIVLSDEVYEHIIFDGKKHQSVLLNEGLRKRSLFIASFGKTFHATGWKVGYCIAPPEITQEFRKVHQFNTFCTHTPSQLAYADYILNRKEYLDLPAFYEKRRNKFISLVKNSRFEAVPASGTYFQLLSYKGISDEKDSEFAKKLTIENGIASIPISVFFSSAKDEKVLRFCFAKKDETLERAAEILCQI